MGKKKRIIVSGEEKNTANLKIVVISKNLVQINKKQKSKHLSLINIKIMQFNQMSPVNTVSESREEGVSLELTHNIG